MPCIFKICIKPTYYACLDSSLLPKHPAWDNCAPGTSDLPHHYGVEELKRLRKLTKEHNVEARGDSNTMEQAVHCNDASGDCCSRGRIIDNKVIVYIEQSVGCPGDHDVSCGHSEEVKCRFGGKQIEVNTTRVRQNVFEAGFSLRKLILRWKENN